MAGGWQVSRTGPKGGSRHREEPSSGAEDNPGNREKTGMTGAWESWRLEVGGEYRETYPGQIRQALVASEGIWICFLRQQEILEGF